jgi:hypothetical protein
VEKRKEEGGLPFRSLFMCTDEFPSIKRLTQAMKSRLMRVVKEEYLNTVPAEQQEHSTAQAIGNLVLVVVRDGPSQYSSCNMCSFSGKGDNSHQGRMIQ